MADTFQLEIVTPEKKVVDTAAQEVQIPGKNGYLGVLPGHAPLITELAVGEITFREGAGVQKQRLTSGDTTVDVERALDALQRAETRLDVASGK